MQIRIDKFGRVLIPKRIRQKLDLQPGEILQLEESGKRIIISPDSNTARNKKLKSFEKLLEHNKQFNLAVNPDINISELADEVNS